MAAPKMTKNQMRRAKKKERKKVQTTEEPETSPDRLDKDVDTQDAEKPTNLEVQQTTEAVDATPAGGLGVLDGFEDIDDPAFAEFRDIFEKFGALADQDEVSREANAGNKGEVFFDEDDHIPGEEEDDSAQPKLSKKKRKQLNKLSIAELKALARIPEVVEWPDINSSDPRLLVQIKSQRNVVPVPPHWSLKREYLSSKRGIEKTAFRLPKFIADTGIAEMRDAVLEKQEQQTLKQKQRERVQPKMGRLDIDYQRLYDAFFRFQSKPELTRFGEVYYEGKESEVDFRFFRPGDLSDATKEALGMPPGAPPPWLINQQRFGPPPSYPTLKIPGLNAPPPPGGSWGFHAGGWGKPPVDEFNRPLYGGDVFGLTAQNGAAGSGQGQAAQALVPSGEPVERTLWGELQPRDEESEEEESEDEDEADEDEDLQAGLQTPGGLETPGGFVSSVPTDLPGQGVETSIAGEMDLRKARRGFDTEESFHPRSAYTVLPEKQARVEGFFGSDRIYDLKAARGNVPVLGQDDENKKRKKPGDVDVALDPDSLQQHDGISKDALRRKFEEGKKEEGIGAQWSAYDEDLSEMIAQESRKRQKVEEKSSSKKRESKYRF